MASRSKSPKDYVDFLRYIALACFAIFLLFMLAGGTSGLGLGGGDRVLAKAQEAEYEEIKSALGAESAKRVQSMADGWYNALIVQHDVKNKMIYTFAPTEDEIKRSNGLENLGHFWFKSWKKTVDNTMDFFYWVLMRAAMVVVWLPAWIAAFIAAAWDGMYERQIKRWSFQYSSPVVNHLSSSTVHLMLTVAFVLMFVPIAMNPMYVPVAVGVAAILLGIQTGTVQKTI